MNIEVSELRSSSVLSAMTPRDNIVFFDLNEEKDSICRKIALHPHSKYPVCKNSIDTVIGYADISSLRTRTGTDEALSLRSGHIVRKPLLIFATMSLFEAIEQFRDTRQNYALVINKDSQVTGLLTVTDVINAVTGQRDPHLHWSIAQRADRPD